MADLLSLTGKWGEAAQKLETVAANLEGAIERAVTKEALRLRDLIRAGIVSQKPGGKDFAPLSPWTMANRKFAGQKQDKALIVRGDLMRSVTMVKSGSGAGVQVTVGVHKGAKGAAGQPLVNVAMVHEYGSKPFTVALTEKAKRRLGALLGFIRKYNLSVGKYNANLAKRNDARKAKGQKELAAKTAINLPGAGGSGGGVVEPGSAGGGGEGPKVVVIQIPARPFLTPTWEVWKPGVGDRVRAQVAKEFGLS